MKADLYTKAILSIIAGCLLWIVARDVRIVPEAGAQAALPAGGQVMKVDIVKFGGMDVGNAWGALPVKLDEVNPRMRGSVPVQMRP